MTRHSQPRAFAALLTSALGAFALAGCGHGGAPSNGFVEVSNLSDAGASFHWQSPGLLGTTALGGSGTEQIAPRALYTRGFGPGEQQLTITTAVANKTFTVAAPTSGEETLWVTITPAGGIEETAEAAAPASPFCADAATGSAGVAPMPAVSPSVAPEPTVAASPNTIEGMPLVPLPAGTLKIGIPDVESAQPGASPTGPYAYLTSGAKGSRGRSFGPRTGWDRVHA